MASMHAFTAPLPVLAGRPATATAPHHVTPRMEAAPPTPVRAPPRKKHVRVPSFRKLQERQAALADAVQTAAARKDAEREARRQCLRERNRGLGKDARLPLEALHVGAEVTGVVHNLVRHGAYVDIGACRDGLVHVRDMGVHFVHDPRDVCVPGERVTAWVKYVNIDTNTLALTFRRPVASPRSQRKKTDDYHRGQRVEGVVERVTNYGAYIDIGAACPAFLQVRNLWGRRPRETLDTLTLGRPIWVVVTDVDQGRNYIAVSARGCNLRPIDEQGNVLLDEPARLPSGVKSDVVLARPGDEQAAVDFVLNEGEADGQVSPRTRQSAAVQAMHMLAEKTRDDTLLREFGMATQTEEWDDVRHMFHADTVIDMGDDDDDDDDSDDSEQ